MTVMKKKNILLSLLLVVIMSSCDYFGDYLYYVENRLETDTVTIKMQRADFRYSEEIKDSVFVILPNERKLINVFTAGAMLKHEHPSDIMKDYNKLQFEVFINNIKLEKNLCERQYWEYTTKPLEGTYLLVINEPTISEQNE
jgi:hypothetical protein